MEDQHFTVIRSSCVAQKRWKMLAVDCFNRVHDKKRRHDSLESSDVFTVFGKRVRGERPTNSIIATCGEFSSPECSRLYMDESVSVDQLPEVENTGSNLEEDSADYMVEPPPSGSYSEQAPASIITPKLTPVGHKGRSMNDYCTVLSVKKSSKPTSEKVVHFNDATMMVVSPGEEPVRVDTVCRGCRVNASDSTYLVQCSFCNHKFCGSSCVCLCENCGGVFCHATCSTLNYSSIFVKTLCLECNEDERQRGNYYS